MQRKSFLHVQIIGIQLRSRTESTTVLIRNPGLLMYPSPASHRNLENHVMHWPAIFLHKIWTPEAETLLTWD